MFPVLMLLHGSVSVLSTKPCIEDNTCVHGDIKFLFLRNFISPSSDAFSGDSRKFSKDCTNVSRRFSKNYEECRKYLKIFEENPKVFRSYTNT